MAIKRDFRFENLPPSAQYAIFTVVLLCLAFVFHMYYMKDLIKKRTGLEKDIAKLEQSVAQGTAIESQLRRFKQELAQLEERLQVLQSILPAQKETPAVLRSVQQMAAASNLKINRFTPKPRIPLAFYVDWPIEIEVEGNYDGLGAFFEKVSRATRIIDVGAVSIHGAKEQSPDQTKTLTATCTATTFVFREEEAAAPEDTGGKTARKKEKKQP